MLNLVRSIVRAHSMGLEVIGVFLKWLCLRERGRSDGAHISRRGSSSVGLRRRYERIARARDGRRWLESIA